jgi:hypothetical protein
MVKKKRLLFIVVIVLCCRVSVFSGEDLLYALRAQVNRTDILDYLIAAEYHHAYRFIYQLYGENGLFPLRDAFKITNGPAHKETVNGITCIESYTYYGMDVEIYRIPALETVYYLAKIDITKQGIGYDLLLFNERGVFLDNYVIASNLRTEPNNLFECITLHGNIYAIKAVTLTYRALYVTFIVIEDDKFRILSRNEVWR